VTTLATATPASAPNPAPYGAAVTFTATVATREEAQRQVTEYIEVFYNRMRRQARLGFLSPEAFRQQYLAKPLPT